MIGTKSEGRQVVWVRCSDQRGCNKYWKIEWDTFEAGNKQGFACPQCGKVSKDWRGSWDTTPEAPRTE